MKTRYLLNAASIVLIALALIVTLIPSLTVYSYEIAVFLSFAALILFFVSAMTKKRPSMSAARVKTASVSPVKDTAVRFSDVAANDAARKSLSELVDFLKKPEKYTSFGARIPHGVLLYGPPGTGKTLLARALAGEANVPFLAMNGSDFVEMYVGVGASRVRDTFKKARKYGKCVIFIDEIDTLGKARSGASNEERDQTLNALLSEMSGFHPSDGIIVVAATNRYDMLDPALLRPGRFDRKIEVGMPDYEERKSILKLHAKNKPLSKEIDLNDLARITSFFSGASLENLLNEAAIRAVRRDAQEIEKKDLDKAYFTITAGDDGNAHKNESERRIIAVHEAGHALSARALFKTGSVQRISILPSSGGAAGYNLLIPEEKMLYTKEDMEKKIVLLLSGRCAEHLVFGEDEITSGASGDLKRAGETAVSMVNDLAFYDHPAVHEGVFSASFGVSRETGERAKTILKELYAASFEFLKDNSDTLIALSNKLLERETLDTSEIDEFFLNHPIALSNDSNLSAKEDPL